MKTNKERSLIRRHSVFTSINRLLVLKAVSVSSKGFASFLFCFVLRYSVFCISCSFGNPPIYMQHHIAQAT